LALYPDILTGETPKTSKLKTWSWGAGILLLAYFYAYFNAMTTGDVDLAECHALESAVTAKHTILLSVSTPGSPGVFCDRAIQLPFLRHYEKVYVYGVTDARAQDGILTTLRDFNSVHHHERILVAFFTKENWQTWSDSATGSSGGRRGPETPTRSLWIK
jgi:hypothetical protein